MSSQQNPFPANVSPCQPTQGRSILQLRSLPLKTSASALAPSPTLRALLMMGQLPARKTSGEKKEMANKQQQQQQQLPLLKPPCAVSNDASDVAAEAMRISRDIMTAMPSSTTNKGSELAELRPNGGE